MKLSFSSLAVFIFALGPYGCSGSNTGAFETAAPRDSPKPEQQPPPEDTNPIATEEAIVFPVPKKTAEPVISKPPKAVAKFKPNEPFQPCILNDAHRVTQPITAKVYQLSSSTGSIAAATLGRDNFRTKICMTKFNVPTRSFTDGFPNVPNLFEWFGIDARAKIVIPSSGEYRFRFFSDDGAVLYVGGKVVVDHDGQHPPSSKEGSVNLTAGVHDLKVLYFQGPATHMALQLFWTPPGKNEEIVPTSAFRAVSF